MKTIYKYAVSSMLKVPEGAEVLHVGYSSNKLCIWFALETENPEIERYFVVHETGEERLIEGTEVHLATVESNMTREVYHIFEQFKIPETSRVPKKKKVVTNHKKYK